MRILIIEDDMSIAELERDYLEVNGFECDIAADGDTGLEMALKNDYALLVVDIMLPKRDGFSVCTAVRKQKETPIIFLSAKSEDIDKVRGLGLGADDYMTKPFSLEELEARIRAQLRRRGHRPIDTTLRCGTLSLLDDQRTLMIEDRRITLTRHEYRIMELLMQSPGRAFSKREIYEYAWEDVFAADDKTVAVHISNIRGKCGRKDLIETVWGIGFRLNQEGR